MSSQTCVSEQDLRAFVRGELPDEAMGRVTEHLTRLRLRPTRHGQLSVVNKKAPVDRRGLLVQPQ